MRLPRLLKIEQPFISFRDLCGRFASTPLPFASWHGHLLREISPVGAILVIG
jgi:hypothetical protein